MAHDYWRSLEERSGAQTPRLAPELARYIGEELPPATRRSFLKLMGASLGLAGLTSCRWPRELIVPFATRPEGRIPGQAQQFATLMEHGGAALGLLVTSVDGRPVKVEGNPLHPSSLGGTHVWAQASILGLYDPDRSRQVLRDGTASSWDELIAFAGPHFAAARAKRGAGLVVVAGESSSPTLAALRERFEAELPAAWWVSDEPVSWRGQEQASAALVGVPARWRLHLDRARAVVVLDADILNTHPFAVRHARDFASTRRAGQAQSRLWVAEAALTLTGAAADHRLPVRPSQVGLVGLHLLREVVAFGVALPAELAALAAGELPALEPGAQAFVRAAANDLVAHRGAGLVVAGPAHEAACHVALALNAALGNLGSTLALLPAPAARSRSLAELTAAIEAGQVETLLVLGANPVHTAPGGLRFGAGLGRVATSIHLGLYADETARVCNWHLPEAHFLESWGDGRSWDGTYGVQQPLIEPLHGGRSALELLALVLEATPVRGHDLVRASFTRLHAPKDAETAWQLALRDGVVAAAPPPVVPGWRLDTARLAAARGKALAPAGELEVAVVPDSRVWDGRFANNAWLQELPDPLSKLTWDNAALLAPATAARLGVRHGDVVTLALGREVEAPVIVMPGQAPGTVVLPLGGGRTAAGKVGDGVGFNPAVLLDDDGSLLGAGLQVRVTGRRHLLACTQDHHAIDRIGFRGRELRTPEIVREQNLGEVHEPEHEPAHPPLFRSPELAGRNQWAMAIDLSACIGCSVCAVACQAENNISVVGKAQVARSREMAWVRIDRYFVGDEGNPRVAFAPVACQHCEQAPCEQVCPVAATVHNDEGLNQMVYNRCVGTRYCSNNCPFKVRRFNFFNYTNDLPHLRRMAFNPEVTVRSRGVMEKCTYCIQRLERAKIAAHNERRPIADGEIVPACAQACPTGAIVFGDLADADSRVAKLHREGRAYVMLPELDLGQRTHYLARLRNPSPDLEEA
ncbi:MAG: Fe-S-cluster-containing hydrogenase [Thermoanaerobaculaceae bacterium]|nr:Fe-S-cluster-containing hydrogenase [Thermoanaerobaculaceae bacterium]MDI9622037.1 Fe-S-cluster-containing hydrogenase [Acidobacteriota bacterium]HPW54827.1 Fe-S-cluster-containing hydrogenase [Thermoanaerobaculaceae bacterium]